MRDGGLESSKNFAFSIQRPEYEAPLNCVFKLLVDGIFFDYRMVKDWTMMQQDGSCLVVSPVHGQQDLQVSSVSQVKCMT
ncbi:hypothetical protein Dimus_023958 [Dionaea muscipula]